MKYSYKKALTVPDAAPPVCGHCQTQESRASDSLRDNLAANTANC